MAPVFDGAVIPDRKPWAKAALCLFQRLVPTSAVGQATLLDILSRPLQQALPVGPFNRRRVGGWVLGRGGVESSQGLDQQIKCPAAPVRTKRAMGQSFYDDPSHVIAVKNVAMGVHEGDDVLLTAQSGEPETFPRRYRKLHHNGLFGAAVVLVGRLARQSSAPLPVSAKPVHP